MKLTSWSASRLLQYEECPRKARYNYIDKLCSSCFSGRTSGGYGSPVKCDNCLKEILPGPALVRGSRIGKSLEDYVKGEGPIDLEVANQVALDLASKIRALWLEGKAWVEKDIVLDKNWSPVVEMFHPDAWFRSKLDVLHEHTKTEFHVIDWKTGGIDKRTGKIRADDKYDDQLELYQMGTLITFPKVKKVKAFLCFVDAPGNPMVERDVMARRDLKGVQKAWEERVIFMLADEDYEPTPSFKSCQWCPYKKGKGGPCPH